MDTDVHAMKPQTSSDWLLQDSLGKDESISMQSERTRKLRCIYLPLPARSIFKKIRLIEQRSFCFKTEVSLH